jgi:Zn-dependent peptidase ImmA (M78 family)
MGHPTYCACNGDLADLAELRGVSKVSTQTQAGQGSHYRDPRADELRARYHDLYQADEFPVPVEAIAEDLLGLYVEEVDLYGVSGLLYPSERLIQLNANDVPARRRFTLAHEIGHWVCQVPGGQGAPVMCRAEDVAPGADRALEREANVFAAELLLPEPAVRAAADDPAAADLFGVSGEAMRWRLYSFGLGGRPKIERIS